VCCERAESHEEATHGGPAGDPVGALDQVGHNSLHRSRSEARTMRAPGSQASSASPPSTPTVRLRTGHVTGSVHSAFQVAGPISPSTGRPFSFWNCRTTFASFGP
jgi:hypothetical protein